MRASQTTNLRIPLVTWQKKKKKNIYIYVFLKGIIFLIFIYYVNLGPIAVLCKSGSLISEHFLDIRRTYTNDREWRRFEGEAEWYLNLPGLNDLACLRLYSTNPNFGGWLLRVVCSYHILMSYVIY